jgi:hypothetical protein
MFRKWKLGMLATLTLTLLGTSSFAQETKPSFSAKDRELIEAYYNHLTGTLAPGSVDRVPFSPEIEKVLVVGSHVPMQLEKNLQPLPARLESQLTLLTGDYGRYTLGRHVVLVHKPDLAIADIIKNIAVKEPTR